MLNYRHNLVGLFLFRDASRNRRRGYTITRRRFTVFLYLTCLVCCAGCQVHRHYTFRGDLLNINEPGLHKSLMLDRCDGANGGTSEDSFVTFPLTENQKNKDPELVILWPFMDTRHDVAVDSNGCRIRAWIVRKGSDELLDANDQARDAVTSAERLHGYIHLEWKDGDSLPIVTVDIKGKTTVIVGRFERGSDIFDIRPSMTAQSIYYPVAFSAGYLLKEMTEPPASQPASAPAKTPAQ